MNGGILQAAAAELASSETLVTGELSVCSHCCFVPSGPFSRRCRLPGCSFSWHETIPPAAFISPSSVALNKSVPSRRVAAASPPAAADAGAPAGLQCQLKQNKILHHHHHHNCNRRHHPYQHQHRRLRVTFLWQALVFFDSDQQLQRNSLDFNSASKFGRACDLIETCCDGRERAGFFAGPRRH